MSSKPKKICMVNGREQDWLSLDDRGLRYGDGLFETIRFQDGVAPLIALHLDRLVSGCIRLSIDISRASVEGYLKQFLVLLESKKMTSGILKIVVTRGDGGHGYVPLGCANASTALQFTNCDWSESDGNTNDFSRGVRLTLSSVRLSQQPLLAGLKHLNRLEYVLAGNELLKGADRNAQVLLCDTEGRLIESLHHNLFLVRDNVLLTPCLSRAGVEGVMRRHILEVLAPRHNLMVSVGDLLQADLLSADEVFLSNSVRGVWPVIGFESKVWNVGCQTIALMKEIDALVLGELYSRGEG